MSSIVKINQFVFAKNYKFEFKFLLEISHFMRLRNCDKLIKISSHSPHSCATSKQGFYPWSHNTCIATIRGALKTCLLKRLINLTKSIKRNLDADSLWIIWKGNFSSKSSVRSKWLKFLSKNRRVKVAFYFMRSSPPNLRTVHCCKYACWAASAKEIKKAHIERCFSFSI